MPEQEGFGGQILYAPQVENYPGITQISGAEFASNLTEQALALGAQLEMESALGITPTERGFAVKTDCREIECGSVILATGVKRRPLGIAREEELAGQGVSYCAVCDGAFYKGQDVAVVGGGNTALEDALFLASYCRKVTLVHRRESFRAEQRLIDQARKRENIEFVLGAVIDALEGEDSFSGIRLKMSDGALVPCAVAGLFVAVGQIPQNERFSDRVVLDDPGYLCRGGGLQNLCPPVFLPPATAVPSKYGSCQPRRPTGRSPLSAACAYCEGR